MQMTTGIQQNAMLAKFRLAKEQEIADLVALHQKNLMPAPFSGNRPSFQGHLRQQSRAVIAEYKRASPSKGDINLNFSPAYIAQLYAKAGAGAVSVLTEETYFKGSLSYLDDFASSGLPLLRKDFIYHPLQVERTAATPASAILLIVRCLDDAMLCELIKVCAEYSLEPVVEVCDAGDLERAKKANAQIIQVNNRDLDRLIVDKGISVKLIRERAPHEFWITASGIESHDELQFMLDAGFDAALIGSSLMENDNPGEKLKQIIHG